jgi:AcrR family transcriptional regulator
VSKGEVTRRAIIDRALDRAGEVGLEGVTLGVLAEDLQLSKSGLFAHFKSKEALQLEVIDAAVQRFVAEVVRPAISEPRGEPRVRALADRYVKWIGGGDHRGGCLFMALSYEYDDRPGTIRDRLVRNQRDWLDTIAHAARLAVDEGHFHDDLDAEQFAWEFLGISMAYHQASRLFEDPAAETRARTAFTALIERSR